MMQEAFDLVDTLYSDHPSRGYVVRLARPLWQQLAEELAADCRLHVYPEDWDAVQIKNVRFVPRKRKVA